MWSESFLRPHKQLYYLLETSSPLLTIHDFDRFNFAEAVKKSFRQTGRGAKPHKNKNYDAINLNFVRFSVCLNNNLKPGDRRKVSLKIDGFQVEMKTSSSSAGAAKGKFAIERDFTEGIKIENLLFG